MWGCGGEGGRRDERRGEKAAGSARARVRVRGRGGGGGEDAEPARPPARCPRAARRHSHGGERASCQGAERGSGHRCRRRYRARPCCRQDRQLLPHFRFPGQSRCAAPPSRSGPALRAAPLDDVTRPLPRPAGSGRGKTSRVPAAPPRPPPGGPGSMRGSPARRGFESKITEYLLFRLRGRKANKN